MRLLEWIIKKWKCIHSGNNDCQNCKYAVDDHDYWGCGLGLNNHSFLH